MSGKQHVDMHRKIMLRRALIRALGKPAPGEQRAAYVPFIGDGDIAVELYGDMLVYGADLDPERVATANSRLQGEVRVYDCDAWPFADLQLPTLHVGDFDAYSYPYESFRAAWRNTEWADKVAVFFTDGMKQAISRTGSWRDPDGSAHKSEDLTLRRKRYNAWLTRHLHPWLKEEAASKGYRVGRKMGYQRGNMVYWGAVLSR